ncbi:MAG: putative efflux rane protein [Arthrobacter sp.]|nr:putative efflux rane protein [Arthrobacter sp.]
MHGDVRTTRRTEDPRGARWLLVACLIGIFSTTFPATILTISLQPIALDLSSRPSTIAWVTTAPMLASAVATPVLGRLGDLRGHRRLYLFGLVLAGTFSVLTAVAWDATSLIGFRTMSQLGAAATVPATFAILFRVYPAEQRVRASSLASGTLAGAAVVGVVIGGPLVDLVGWRPIFLVHAGIAFLALAFAFATLPKDDDGVRAEGDLDVAGAAALAVATLLLTFGVNRLGAWGLSSIPLVCLALVPFAVWVLILVERRAASPLLPLRVLSARNTRVVCAATFLLGAGWMGNFVITPLLLLSVLGISVAVTSLITVPRATFIMLAAPVAGRLGVRYGERRLVVVASAGLALVLGLMAVGAAIESVVVIAVALPLSGWALGHAQPGLISAMGHAVREEDFGVAVSLQQTANQLGAVVGIGLFTALAADSTTRGPFVLVFLLTAGCAAAAAALALRMHDSRGIEPHLPPPVDDGSELLPLRQEKSP